MLQLLNFDILNFIKSFYEEDIDDYIERKSKYYPGIEDMKMKAYLIGMTYATLISAASVITYSSTGTNILFNEFEVEEENYYQCSRITSPWTYNLQSFTIDGNLIFAKDFGFPFQFTKNYLYQDIDGDLNVDRIKINPSIFSWNRDNELYLRETDYETNKELFDEASSWIFKEFYLCGSPHKFY